MKNKILVSAVALFMGWPAVSAFAGDGIVSLYSVNGMTVGDSVLAGHPVRFVIRYTNNTGQKCDVSTGFRLQSPDGATWDSTSIDSVGPNIGGKALLRTRFPIAYFQKVFSGDGQPPDTVGFLGAGMQSQALQQLPAGYDDSAFAVMAWFSKPYPAGKHICIDTSFFPPGGTWVWIDAELNAHYPSFVGLTSSQEYTPGYGYCFRIFDLVAPGNVLHVPGDYGTIQAAINAATDGDTVVVSPGLYTENIAFLGKRILVTSIAGPDSTTIKAADPTLPVVSFSQNEPKGAVLRGFTVTGSGYGGIECLGSSPTVIGNHVVGNRSSRQNNSSGISLKNTVGSLIRGNIIAFDTAYAYGPGMHLGDNGKSSQNDTICFNILYGNIGVDDIRILGTVTNLSIFNNTIDSPTNWGIGINANGTIDIRNNIITGLSANYAIGMVGATGTYLCEYNCLFNNPENFYNVQVGSGNVLADPLYTNTSGHNYALLPGSPCINSGDPNPIYNDPDGTRNDIGAIPFVGGQPPTADTLRVPADRPTIQAAINDVKDGGTVLVAPGTYAGGLLVTGKSVEIKSTRGPDVTVITAPDNVDLIQFSGPAATPSVLEGFSLLGGHIGIWCQLSGPTIRHNILAYQHVTDWAALSIAGPGYPYATEGPAPAIIINNTIVHSANGGISTFSTVAPVLRNNIVAFNGYYGVHRQATDLPLIAEYNDIYGNPSPYFNWPDSAIGTVLGNPLLDSSFHLMTGSPCINAGDPNPIYNDPDSSRNDLGAIPFSGGGGGGGPIPTNEWIILYCPHAFVDSNGLQPGTVLTAYNPRGVLCGKVLVETAGKFGPMLVYADDPYTQIDEGAKPGDVISFKLNGQPIFSNPPVIWARNGDLFQVCSFQTGVCQQIPIHNGWNLISWNVGFDGKTEDLIAGIKSCVDLMLSFDQGGLVYLPNLPEFSTLTNVDHHHGYWIKANCNTTLTVCGKPTGCGDAITIFPGWNLVSFLPTTSLPVPTAFATIMGNLQVALGYDNGGKTYLPGKPEFNTLTELDPGFGYWARSSGSATLWYFQCGDSVVRYCPTSTVSSTAALGSRLWMSVYGSGLTLDGTPVPKGTPVEFVTSDNVVVGRSTYSDGLLKFTAVYGADEQDASTKSFPSEGDRVFAVINGAKLYPAITWTGQGTVQKLTELFSSAETMVPREYNLGQNFPNPFNPQTTISFGLPEAGRVRVVVYNVLGQAIKTLADDNFAAGSHKLHWDGTNAAGTPVSSGVYFYRIEANSYKASKKMILLK